MSCNWWDNNAFTGDGELFGLARPENSYLEISKDRGCTDEICRITDSMS